MIAFDRGALAETIDHGRTGFLVHDEIEMAKAIADVAGIDPDECRRSARERFSLERTMQRYAAVYEQLARFGSARAKAGAL